MKCGVHLIFLNAIIHQNKNIYKIIKTTHSQVTTPPCKQPKFKPWYKHNTTGNIIKLKKGKRAHLSSHSVKLMHVSIPS